MSEKFIFTCTHGKDEAERSTLPLVAANVAALAGQEAVMLCTIDAVWLGTAGGGDGIAAPGLPVFNDLYNEFIANGGQVWLCGACTKPRGITEDQLRPGSIIVGAARVVEEVVNGARTIAFA
jgi:predicted peroxiredoxin